jgi:hypothetical protein
VNVRVVSRRRPGLTWLFTSVTKTHAVDGPDGPTGPAVFIFEDNEPGWPAHVPQAEVAEVLLDEESGE